MLHLAYSNRQGSVKLNPCLGVKRNKETKRERYVEHDEYRAVWAVAAPQVRGLLDLTYRTLQRPEDIIAWGPANIVQKREPDGSVRRVIRNDQGKTGAIVDIAVTPEIDAILNYLKATGPTPGLGQRGFASATANLTVTPGSHQCCTVTSRR